MGKERERSPKLHELKLSIQEQYWKQYPAEYIPFSLVWADALIKLLKPGSKILDIGCGQGIKPWLLAQEENVFSVMGIDINHSAIKRAKEKYSGNKKLKFEFGNGRVLRFADESFDVVMAAGVVGIEEPKGREEMLKEMYRVLKPGGMVALVEFGTNFNVEPKRNKYLDDFNMMRELGMEPEWGSRIIRKRGKILFITKHFEKDSLMDLLREAGFSSVSTREEYVESVGPGDDIRESRRQITVWGFKEQSPSKEETRSYEMVIFDMDDTLIAGSGVWQELFASLGISDEYKQLKEKFGKEEQSNYIEWTRAACEMLKTHGLTGTAFSEIVNRQPFMKGAKETIEELKAQGIKTVVITGGFSALAKRVQKELGVDEIIAHCDLKFDADDKLEDWELLPCDYADKPERLKERLSIYEIDPSECVYIGDGINDIPIFQFLEKGLPIAFNSRTHKVKDVAPNVVGGDDLRLVLKLLFPK